MPEANEQSGSDESGGETFDRAPAPQETVLRSSPLPSMPKRIGRYTIRQVIASGGMGTVYLAVQEDSPCENREN